MQEKDCTAFLFLSSVLIKSLHHVGNFPWVVYLLPDNMRLLNMCAKQALLSLSALLSFVAKVLNTQVHYKWHVYIWL